ncbi:MAG: TolC family protein [Salibacteraceae bacterium]
MRAARGGFDPKLGAALSRKYFDNKLYYNTATAALSIPTSLLGITFDAGYESASGYYLNPENTTPADGLLFAGVKASLGKGLFIDQRRAALRQASVIAKQSAQEQRLVLNNLLYEAGKAYWEWYEAVQAQAIYENALQVARERYEQVKLQAQLGDRPMVDTLEVGIQLQARMLLVQQAQLNAEVARLKLSSYTWDEDGNPVYLRQEVVPAPISQDAISTPPGSINLQIDTLVALHPELRMSRLSIDYLEIEKRWKAEQLKPSLNVKYNALTSSIPVNRIVTGYDPADYRLGVEFSMPLFLRKERAGLREVQLKIQQKRNDLASKQLQLQNKALGAIATWEGTARQIRLYSKTVQDYGALFEAERQLFDGGESSLFMVNSREMFYINAQIKLLELMVKNRKAALETEYAAGLLAND